MDLMLRLCLGGAVILAGLGLYGFARARGQFSKKLTWGDVVVLVGIMLVGVAVMAAGDRILSWTTLPLALRWTCIGIDLVVAVACYVLIPLGLDRGLRDREALILYLIAFFLFLVGIRFAALEFEL